MATPIQEIQKVIDNIRHVLTQDKTTLSVDLAGITLTVDVEQALCNFFDSLKLPEDHNVDFALHNANPLTPKLIKHIFLFLRREKIRRLGFHNTCNLFANEHLETYAKELRDFIQQNPIIHFSLANGTIDESKYFYEILRALSENVPLRHLKIAGLPFSREASEMLFLILAKVQLVELQVSFCTLYLEQFSRLIDQSQKAKSLKSLNFECLMFFDCFKPEPRKIRKIIQRQLIELILTHPALEHISIHMPQMFHDVVLSEQDEYFKRFTKPNTGLKRLSLSHIKLNNDAVDLYVKILPFLPNLTEISLNHINLTHVNLTKMVVALEKHPQLQFIEFGINNHTETFKIDLGGDDELVYPEHYDKAYARLLDLKQVKVLTIPIAGIHSLQALEKNQTLEKLIFVKHSKNSTLHSYFPFIDELVPTLQKNTSLLSIDLPSAYREAEVRELMLRNNKLHRNQSRQSCIVAMSAAYGVKLLSRDRPFKDVFPLIFAFLGMPVKGKELYAKAKPDVRGKLPKGKLPQKPDLIPVGSKTVRMLDEDEVLKLYEEHCDAAQPHERLQNGESYRKKRRIELHPKPLTPAFSGISKDSDSAAGGITFNQSGGEGLGTIDMDIADDDQSTSAFSADPKNYSFDFS